MCCKTSVEIAYELVRDIQVRIRHAASSDRVSRKFFDSSTYASGEVSSSPSVSMNKLGE